LVLALGPPAEVAFHLAGKFFEGAFQRLEPPADACSIDKAVIGLGRGLWAPASIVVRPGFCRDEGDAMGAGTTR
jgi:hypothetical protein